jgi:hypothetical protein
MGRTLKRKADAEIGNAANGGYPIEFLTWQWHQKYAGWPRTGYFAKFLVLRAISEKYRIKRRMEWHE